MSANSLVVVGAGVFGLSTVRAWKQKYPTATIFLINRSSSLDPASLDTAKIVRTAYAVPEYVDLASEARTIWQTDKLLSKYWHKSGWVVVNSHKPIGITGGTPLARERFSQIFSDGRLSTQDLLTEDLEIGWVEATAALKEALSNAISDGITYVQDEAVSLLWEEDVCLGVQLKGGKTISASSIVLAMGYQTPIFLRQCRVDFDQRTCQSAGVSVLGIKLNDEQYERYKDMPILAVVGLGKQQFYQSVGNSDMDRRDYASEQREDHENQ